MTREEFKKTLWMSGMSVVVSGDLLGSEKTDKLPVVSTNFDQQLIGVDGDCDICEACENAIEMIDWYRCENCTVFDGYGNQIGTAHE